MRTGNKFFLIAYVLVCLLSGTHLTDIPESNKQAIVGVLDFFASFGEKEEHADEACLCVVYALNGGTNHTDNKTIIYEKDFPFQLNIPEREGYNFAGWYTDSNFKHKVTQLNSAMFSEIVLFAKWTEKIDNYYNVRMYSYETVREEDESHRKTLVDGEYHFWDDISIPGMPKTRESDYLNNYITQATQCMQGLCFTPEYILMTSYAESTTVPGTLMIFDRETGEFLLSLSMKVNSHLGGVAYDGENVWVCHSEQNTLERIDYAFLQRIVNSGADYCVDISGMTQEYKVQNTPSCIAYYGNRIWVATHSLVFDGTMVSYAYNAELDRLIPYAEYKIPKEVQGVAFSEDGAVYFSTSYGRRKSSYLKSYPSLLALEQELEKPSLEIEMPPCSEEVVFENGSLVVLFESASEKYFEGTDGNGVSKSPLDTLLEINLASF